MAKDGIPRARINGSFVILPDNRVRIPDALSFTNACREVGIEISVRKNIIKGLEYLYGPLRMTLNFNENTLYSALETTVQMLPEWQVLRKKSRRWYENNHALTEKEKKRKRNIDAYWREFSQRAKRYNARSQRRIQRKYLE